MPSQTDDTQSAAEVDSPVNVVRLSINLAPDVAEVLKRIAAQKGISVTEGVRRAIAIWHFFEEERAKGNRIAVIESDGPKERIREVVLI